VNRTTVPDLQATLRSIGVPAEQHASARFDLSRPEEHEAFARVLGDKAACLSKNDCLERQVRELLETRSPAAVVSEGDVAAYIEQRGGDAFGIWVYYPWLGIIVRTLPEPEFHELRTSRNRYKITPDEQRTLRTARIGIVGLSAGHSIAVTLALEGVGSEFRLADFDVMELSNTNRVACGIPALGANKAVLAARRLHEIDPFLDVRLFRNGITHENAEAFLTEGSRVDLLVEECDDLALKVRLRELARRLRIPVIMETNDRGLLDVERFDLEPDRPILHGLIGDTTSRDVAGMDPQHRIEFVRRIVGANLSPRALTSLAEMGRSLKAWPQLGSSTALGGALVTDAARRVLLGQLNRSSRSYVDLEALVQDDPRP
jgi:hypothetical protein